MATDLIRKAGDPIEHEVVTLRDAMERLWDSPFTFNPFRWVSLANAMDVDAPAVDMSETTGDYTLKAALPGWKPENVEITYEHGMVTIKGEAKEETEEKDAKYHRKEIRSKSFSRSFELPIDVEPDQTKAEFKDGLLTIKLPKSEIVKHKQIKIQPK